MGFGVWGLGFRVQGSGFRFQGSGFRVWGGGGVGGWGGRMVVMVVVVGEARFTQRVHVPIWCTLTYLKGFLYSSFRAQVNSIT